MTDEQMSIEEFVRALGLELHQVKVKKAAYTHIHADGTNIHIDAQALRSAILRAVPERWEWVEISQEIADAYVKDNVVDMRRVNALTDAELQEPAIFALFDDPKRWGMDGMHVDGHHRYVRLALQGFDRMKGYLTPEIVWREFELRGCADLTADQLRSAPVAHREYWKHEEN